jgi:dipeptidase D
MPSIAQYYFVRAMYTAHNGVYSMSADFADLVETSNNIAKVVLGEGKLSVQCLTRSSVETSKFDLANALTSALKWDVKLFFLDLIQDGLQIQNQKSWMF